ncbi:hypothetical protein [Deinococcus puniceus]|uniref:Uncharacterized protein n=1 Tax=Deinococcus puniceus TaxID=1182568 RepID=A0A172TB27_9DEIO|nr:hypothetical protein [Deinococcus puniceus]ANE44162.1 hypothetical protein SU48_10705 [Deinococcus puniceus]
MSIFTEQKLKLLAQSAHHSPRLAEWLERVLTEGPGDYDWMLTAEGFYTNDQIPLFENILAEIEDQGTIYPATLVAVPVLCQLPKRFPQQDHSVLLETLDRLEEARRVQNYDGAAVPEPILAKYAEALADLKANVSNSESPLSNTLT